MSQMTDTGRVQPITGQITAPDLVHVNQEILQRVTGLIRLGTGFLNSLICLRYLLKLMDANPTNSFAELVYSTTQPLLSVFEGLIRTVTYKGIVFELYDLIAIVVYGMIGWLSVQLLRVMFGRVR